MASLSADLDTMIVPKLALHDPVPVVRVVARQFAKPRRRRWPWLIGAVVLAAGLVQPIDPVSQARALRLTMQAQRVLDALPR